MLQSKKIRPQGCTVVYASPEQLYARQVRLECTWVDDASSEAGSNNSISQGQPQSTGAPVKGNKLMQRLASLWNRASCRGKGAEAVEEEEDDNAEEDLLVNGPAVDVYSAGVVLYEMVCISPLQSSICLVWLHLLIFLQHDMVSCYMLFLHANNHVQVH